MMIVQRRSSVGSERELPDAPQPQEDDARAAWLALYRLFRSDEAQRAGVEAAEAEDLTAQQFATLLALPVDPHEGLSMRDLAAACRSTASYMTSVVDRLEERGLVGRHTDPLDRRVAHVRLTEEGRGAVRRAHARLSVPPTGLRELPPDDVHTLRLILERAAAAYPWP